MGSRLRDFFLGQPFRAGSATPLERHTLPSPDGPRPYVLACPSVPAQAPRPLLILLHGYGASGAQLMGEGFPPSPLSHWRVIAAREQWLVAAPDGIRRSWNDAFADARINPTSDDCGFIRGLIDHLVSQRGADPERVYVMGVSKGGMMSLRLASELAPELAAFSAVLASMPLHSKCPPPRTPLSALFIASTSDPMVRYQGGSFWHNRLQTGAMLGVEASVDIWRRLARLPESPDVRHSGRADGEAWHEVLGWGDDAQALQVRLVRLHGNGHAEPSPSIRYPRWIQALAGKQYAGFETAELAYSFFKDKRRIPLG